MIREYIANRIIGLLVVGIGSCMALQVVAVTHEPAGVLTRAQAHELAETRHPALRVASLESQAAGARSLQAARRPNPELAVEAENFGGRDEYEGWDGAEFTARIEQTLELGGKRGARVGLADVERQLAGLDIDARRLAIRAETERRFVAVLGAQERLALDEESLALAEEFVQAVSARVRAGKVAPMDEDKARILLAQQRVARENAQGELQVARVQLASMWGSIEPAFDRVDGNLRGMPPVAGLPTLLARMRDHPGLGKARMEIRQRGAVLAREKAARWPDITVAGGVRRYAETDRNAFVAGVTVPLPVFDRNQAGVREAGVLLEKAEHELRAAEVEAIASLTEAYQKLSAAMLRIAALERDVIPRSESVFKSVRKGYTEGKFAYLDVLDARRTFFDARAEYVEALVLGHQARVDVERLVGGSAAETAVN